MKWMMPSLVAVAALTSPAPAQQPAALPSPSGRFPIGTTVVHLSDSTRRDLLSPAIPRKITLQLWYPAVTRAKQFPATAYILEPKLLDTLLATGYYGQDSTLLRGWTSLRTHATLDAQPAAEVGRPLLFFSHGLGVARANYTVLAEHFASHGYVVALVDHPYGGEAITDDGRHLSSNNDPADLNDADTLTQRTVEWARDLSFVLDRLPELTASSVKRVVNLIDYSRVGATGHSMGGVAALEWCARDRRAVACANLDGFPTTPDGSAWTSIVADGVVKPSLIMRSEPVYSDSELIAKGRTREGWNKGAVTTAALWDSITARSHALFIVGSVRGTGHFSYTDGPFVMPTTITRFGGRILEFRRAQTIIGSALLAFFDAELSGKPLTSFYQLTSQYPEFTIYRH